MKKFKKASMDIIGSGVILGAGAEVVSGIGGSTAASAGQGISKMASFMPIVGTVTGAGMAINSLKMLNPPKRKKR